MATQHQTTSQKGAASYFRVKMGDPGKRTKMPSDLATIIVRNAPPEVRRLLKQVLMAE